MTELSHPPAEAGRRSGSSSARFSPAASIADRMVRLIHHYTGRGPTTARTTLNTNIVVVAFHDTLTKGEQNLVAAGQSDAVHAMRRIFHDVMGPEAVATVREVLNREVVSFLSDIDPRSNVAAMVFVLEPRPETGRVQVADSPDVASDET